MNDTSIILSITAAVALIAGILLSRYFAHLVRRSVMNRRIKRGMQGEHEAAVFLQRHGHRIIETQAKRQMFLLVDGKHCPFDIRADFITQKKGKKWCIEVKTGAQAVDPVYTATRRQLIEYAVSFDVDGICLFDADSGVLREIGLPMLKPGYRTRFHIFIFGFIAGLVLALLVLLR